MNEKDLNLPEVKQIDLLRNNDNVSDKTPERTESLKQFAHGAKLTVSGAGTHKNNDRNMLEMQAGFWHSLGTRNV